MTQPWGVEDWAGWLLAFLPLLGGLLACSGVMVAVFKWLRWAGSRAIALSGLALGAWHLSAASASAGLAAGMALAGCAASLAACLVLSEAALRDAGKPHVFERLLRIDSIAMGIAWSAAGIALHSELCAWLAATALALAAGGPRALERRATRERPWLLIRAGVALIVLGFAILAAGRSETLYLVRALWTVGLLCVLHEAADLYVRGDGRAPLLHTLLLALAATVGGVLAGQGLFVALGGLALMIWGHALLIRLLGGALPAWKVLASGLYALALTRGLETWWEPIVRLLGRGLS